jgi:hypothetical protein
LQLHGHPAVEGSHQPLEPAPRRLDPGRFQDPGQRSFVAAGETPESAGVLLQQLPVDLRLALGTIAGGGGHKPTEVAIAGAVGD